LSGYVGLKSLQPYLLKSEPHRSYEHLVKVADWLCSYSEKLFTLQVAASACSTSVSKLTALFRKLPMVSRKTSQRGAEGNYWRRQDVLQFLQIHGVVNLQIGGSFSLNPKITGDYSTDLSRFSVYPYQGTKGQLPSINDNNLIYVPSFSIRPYKAGEIRAYEQLWNERVWRTSSPIHSFSFSSSFIVAQAIVQNVVPEQRTAEIDGRVDPCWLFQGGLDQKGYAHITNQWLQSALPEAGILAEDLPSTGAARLVTMVNHPALDWKDARPQYWGKDKGMVAHHTCQVRNCVNPFHVTPLSWSHHELVHRHLDEDGAQNITTAVNAAWTAAAA
jgi:hypothetical protein